MGRPSKEETIKICYERGMKLGKDQDFIMASSTLTVRYIRLEMFEQYTLLIRVSPILNIFIALLLSFILNSILLIFDKQKLYSNADQELSDPDLNLQLLNDHGIHTVEEINKLSVPYCRTSILCYSLKYKKLKSTF